MAAETIPGPERAFFSYARDDSDFALKLARDLRGAGASLWIDQLDIQPGQRWDLAVERALKSCASLLVILSPDSVRSNNVLDEISYALESGKRVIPVLYQPCEIPFRLRRVQYVNLTDDYGKGVCRLKQALSLEPAHARRGRSILRHRPAQRSGKRPVWDPTRLPRGKCGRMLARRQQSPASSQRFVRRSLVRRRECWPCFLFSPRIGWWPRSSGPPPGPLSAPSRARTRGFGGLR